MKTRIPFFSIAAVVIAIVGFILLANRREGNPVEAGRVLADDDLMRNEAVAEAGRIDGGDKSLPAAEKDGLNDGFGVDGRGREDEESLVKNFDDITDRWIKPSKKNLYHLSPFGFIPRGIFHTKGTICHTQTLIYALVLWWNWGPTVFLLLMKRPVKPPWHPNCINRLWKIYWHPIRGVLH